MATFEQNFVSGSSNGGGREAKRDEFRLYLEKTGVVDALTKVLVALYEEPEKPDNALDYFRRYLGPESGGDDATEALRQENEGLKKRIQELEKELQEQGK